MARKPAPSHVQPPPKRPTVLRGDRIRSLREGVGLTQTQLAYHVGTSPGHVSTIEAGKRDIQSGMLAAFARALGCSSDYLLGLTDDPKPY